jgi:hypothetical protein
MSCKDVEPRSLCDAAGWCWIMSKAVESTGQGRKGLRCVEMVDRSNPRGDLFQAIIYDFGGKAGWATLRVCPFCEGNPNARFTVKGAQP